MCYEESKGSSRKVPIDDVLILLDKAEAAIVKHSEDKWQQALKNRVEYVNTKRANRWFRRLGLFKNFRRYTEQDADEYFSEQDSMSWFGSEKYRIQTGRYSDLRARFERLRSLCTITGQERWVTLTAKDAQILKSWSED